MSANNAQRSWMSLRLFPVAGVPGQTALEALEEWAYACCDATASPLVNMKGRPKAESFLLATGNELAFAVDEMRTRVALGGAPTQEAMGWVKIELGRLEEIAAVA